MAMGGPAGSMQKEAEGDGSTPPFLLHTAESLFGRMLRGRPGMAVDIKDTANAVVIAAELPGVRREDLEVKVDSGNVLTITAARKEEELKNGDVYLSIERSRAKEVVRRFQLQENMEIGRAQAVFDNGLLTVTIPKRAPKEEEKPRVIPVKGSTGLFGQSRL